MRDAIEKLEPGQSVQFDTTMTRSPVSRFEAVHEMHGILPMLDRVYQEALQETAFLTGLNGQRVVVDHYRTWRGDGEPIPEPRRFEVEPAIKTKLSPIVGENDKPIGGRFNYAATVTITITVRRTH